MTQIPVNKNYNTFVRGLITEANPLAFPENASIDEENFELNNKGYRSRRLGLDYENNFELLDEFLSMDGEEVAINTYLWNNVNNTGNLTILVIQIGSLLVFLDASSSPVSGNKLDELTAVFDTLGPRNEIYQFATVNGNLIVVNHLGYIFQYSYDQAEDSISVIRHGLLVRDLWGVPDPRTPKERMDRGDYYIHPKYSEMRYNNTNAGWGQNASTDSISNGSFSRPLDNPSFLQYYAYYEDEIPSLCDSPITGNDPSTRTGFNTNLIKKYKVNSSLAPKGSHIIDLFYRGRTRVMADYYYSRFQFGGRDSTILDNFHLYVDGWDTDFPGGKNFGYAAGFPEFYEDLEWITLASDITEPAIRCVATYSSRLFYAGFNREVQNGYSTSPLLSSYVMYSQVIDGTEKVGRCFQEGDPSSIDNYDLLPTDGGYINVVGADEIIKLVPFTDSLLVFATNGVWEIKGSEGAFSATSNLVRKITTIGTLGSESIVVTATGVFYFSEAGVGLISIDNVTNEAVYSNHSENSIQSLYNGLSLSAKEYSKAVYLIEENKVCWLYNDSVGYDGETRRFSYNKQLNLSLTLNSFYKYSFERDEEDTEFPFIASVFRSPNFLGIVYDSDVVVNLDEVLAGPDEVVVGIRSSTAIQSKLAYLCIKPLESGWLTTIGGLNNASFYDWASDDSGPIDSPAFIETGLETLQEASRAKQAKHLVVHLERTEEGFDEDLEPVNGSSCLMTSKWDFADHSNSGKIASPVQVYRYRRQYSPSGITDNLNYGQSVITTKNKLRGRGKALSLVFSSEEGKNCILYGWDMAYGVNSDV